MPIDSREEQLAEVIQINRLDSIVGFDNAGTQYSAVMTSHVVDACVRLGLGAEFIPVYMNHLKDVNVVFYQEKENPGFEQKHRLYVMRSPEPGDEENSYKRFLPISHEAIRRRQRVLREVFHGMEITEPDQPTVTGLAVDWIFYEACADALNNSCYIQQNYPKYITDFNGQCAYYQTQHTISSNYLYTHHEQDITVAEDTERFRKGFGIMMLHDALIAKSAVGRAQQADWVIQSIRDIYTDAYRSHELSERIHAIKPSKDVSRSVAEFALAYFDPELDDTDLETNDPNASS